MKKNELRLGNIVADRNGFEMFVDGVFKDVVYLDWEGNEGDIWEEKYEDVKGIRITGDHLLKFGFEKKKCITYDWKDEYVLKINEYPWEIGFLLGDYPITNPNVGCISILQSEDEQFSAVPPDLYNKEIWTEEDEKRALNYTEMSKAWRQPIAYGVAYLHQLQNIVFELSRKELTIK